MASINILELDGIPQREKIAKIKWFSLITIIFLFIFIARYPRLAVTRTNILRIIKRQWVK